MSCIPLGVCTPNRKEALMLLTGLGVQKEVLRRCSELEGPCSVCLPRCQAWAAVWCE